MKMKNIAFLLMSFLWLIFTPRLQAQVSGNANYNNRNNANYGNNTIIPVLPYPEFEDDSTITIGANMLMNVKADSYVVIIGLSQAGENAENCNSLMNQRINNFIEKLALLGIKKSEINVDFISQVPVYEYETEKKLFSKTYQEVPAGMYLNKNIHIAYKNAATFEQILAEAAKYEIYDIIKVDYIIENTEVIYDSLRNSAIHLINKKIQSFKKLGLNFSSRFQIVAENYASAYPTAYYRSYRAFSSPSLQNVKKNASVNQLSKPETSFYEPISYEKFDLVINPQIIEPVVQLTYLLKVRYLLKKQ